MTVDDESPIQPPPAEPSSSERIARHRRRRRFVRRFFRSGAGLVGLSILTLFLAAAVLHPILLDSVWERSVYHHEFGNDTILTQKVVVAEVTDPATEIARLDAILIDPFVEPGETVDVASLPGVSLRHPFGTDPLGRDVLSMAMAGAGPAFGLGVSAAIAIFVTSITVATIGAYRRGAVDWALTHVSDTFLLLPAPLLMNHPRHVRHRRSDRFHRVRTHVRRPSRDQRRGDRASVSSAIGDGAAVHRRRSRLGRQARGASSRII